MAPGSSHQLQADLIDFSALKKYNCNFRFVFAVVDVFSRKAFVEVLKNNSALCVTKAFEKNPKRSGSFLYLQTDRGSEFFSASFRALLKKYNIQHFSTRNFDIKVSIVERFIRTLKTILWRYFSLKNTRKYTDVLEDLVCSYNNTHHTSIGCTPNSVNDRNQEDVWLKLYADLKPKKTKFKLNDLVRLTTDKQKFDKVYFESFSRELFRIREIHCRRSSVLSDSRIKQRKNPRYFLQI